MSAFRKSVVRRARKEHRCDGYRCGRGGIIRSGELYLNAVASPGGELGNVGWWRLRECWKCCLDSGRPLGGGS